MLDNVHARYLLEAQDRAETAYKMQPGCRSVVQIARLEDFSRSVAYSGGSEYKL